MGRVLNMIGMGRPMAAVSVWASAQYVWHGPPYGCGLPMGVCLTCVAWAALWLRPPYGRVLSMFGMGRPMVACGSNDRGIRNNTCKRKSTSKSEDEIRNESRAIRPMAPLYNISIYLYSIDRKTRATTGGVFPSVCAVSVFW